MNTKQRTSAPNGGAHRRAVSIVTLGLVAVLVGACTDEFAPYERLSGTRLLAVRADKPSIREGETATLDALVYSEAGEELQYRWSWCPVMADPSNGYECPMTDEQLQAMASSAPAGTEPFPSLELGTGPTIELDYPASRQAVAGLCQALQTMPLPTHMAMPSCERGYDIFVKLELSTPTTTITAVKTIELLIDPDAAANQNPVLDLVDISGSGVEVELLEGAPNELPAASPFTLEVSLTDESIETFVPERSQAEPSPSERDEKPMFTWFVEAGELDYTRTGVVDGASDMSEAIRNVWRLGPSDRDVLLIVVVRDGRGGVDWAERTVRISK